MYHVLDAYDGSVHRRHHVQLHLICNKGTPTDNLIGSERMRFGHETRGDERELQNTDMRTEEVVQVTEGATDSLEERADPKVTGKAVEAEDIQLDSWMPQGEANQTDVQRAGADIPGRNASIRSRSRRSPNYQCGL